MISCIWEAIYGMHNVQLAQYAEQVDAAWQARYRIAVPAEQALMLQERAHQQRMRELEKLAEIERQKSRDAITAAIYRGSCH